MHKKGGSCMCKLTVAVLVYIIAILYIIVCVYAFTMRKIALVAVALSYRSNIGASACVPCVAFLACCAPSVRVYYIIAVASNHDII